MSTNSDFVEYVCKQVPGVGLIRCKKMFGQYLIYANAKPLLLVCDPAALEKVLACVKQHLAAEEAEAHHMPDGKNSGSCRELAGQPEKVVPLPARSKAKKIQRRCAAGLRL